MAPKAEATTWYFNNDLAEMAALAKPDYSSLLISNHSYGTVTGWTKVNGVYDKDPISNNDAVRYDTLSYKQVVEQELGIMDLTAVTLCKENSLPIFVFDLKQENSIRRALDDKNYSTIIS